ncbi:MAG TPA: family 20 glycosylhydrolase [Polyangiaceae bacterium]|nr:family 20 glycosylhydrolase [Polyangiaceae bacterium]
MQPRYSLLCPRPRNLESGSGELLLSHEPKLELGGQEGSPAAGRLERLLRGARLAAANAESVSFSLELEPGDAESEAYNLEIDVAGARISASSKAGLFYGVCTLGQLLELGARAGRPGTVSLPVVRIQDQPSFARRGVMLDISRDKVPTLETTLQLVELLASLKINELQLYMEHTFAYAGHEKVWENASPFTAADVRTLDAFCRERHIDLVPNQNSFGHMQRWLAFEPYRSELAEAPNGFEHAWNPTREPYGLCPTDPRSLAFLNDLYDQLLPHFTSRTFNVGLDETFDLGLGRSKEACEARGTERVYLDFLKEIHETVGRRGFTMQFWGDIIIKRPELIPELPKDAIAMEWGYEHDHPFAENVAKFAAAGLRFYVCPGTSSWNTIAGRTENALLNIASAVKHGAQHGALGVLNTDWGDNGHLQPLCASYIGFLAGAAMSWKAEDAQAPLELPIAEWLDSYVFSDRDKRLGALTRDLGNAYRELGCRPHNASALFYFIAGRPGQPIQLPGIEAQHFDAGLAYLARIDAELARVAPLDVESRRSQAELVWASDLLKAACRIGKARLGIGFDEPVSKLAPGLRESLASELAPLIERHRALWLGRNRPGGLRESAGQIERVLEQLQG